MPSKQKHHNRKQKEKPEENAAKLNLLSSLIRLLATLIETLHK